MRSFLCLTLLIICRSLESLKIEFAGRIIPIHCCWSVNRLYTSPSYIGELLSSQFLAISRRAQEKLLIYFLMNVMNYVWKKNEIDSEAREARNGSNIIESRNWSNKKLVCFSNYSLLGSPLWLLPSSHRLIIIEIKCLRELRQISFSF